jgi:xanthine/CO dehydrogenase XdhC/CoxF family maturation factor
VIQSSAIEIKAILAALGTGPAALATLVNVLGSSYRQPGARSLLLPDGRTIGSISGGCLEEDVRVRARQVLESGDPQLVLYDTAAENDLLWGTGLGCQGQVRVFIERLPAVLPAWVGALRENFHARRDTTLAVVYEASAAGPRGTRLLAELPEPPGSGAFVERIAPPPTLIVFGAGDDAMPLVRFASQLGWQVTLFDVRPAYATAARFPEAHDVAATAAEDASRHPAIDAGSHVIVMTHRYRDDLAALRWLLPRPLAYVGILGPHRRTARILDELRAEGLELTAEMRERLFAPVGIDLGGASPETVALSIVAELQAFRSKRSPQHLRDSTRPIHD